MSFIKIRDNFGGNNFLPERINVRIAEGTKSSDEAFDDKFTDNGGNISFVGLPSIIDITKGVTLYANYRDINSHFGSNKLFVPNIEEKEVTIVLDKLGSQPNACPVNYDKSQFHNWFFSLVNKYQQPIVSTNAMGMMKDDVRACGMFFQNQEFFPNDPSKWRPRIHQPPINANHDSDHNVDLGDFGLSWVLTFRY